MIFSLGISLTLRLENLTSNFSVKQGQVYLDGLVFTPFINMQYLDQRADTIVKMSILYIQGVPLHFVNSRLSIPRFIDHEQSIEPRRQGTVR